MRTIAIRCSSNSIRPPARTEVATPVAKDVTPIIAQPQRRIDAMNRRHALTTATTLLACAALGSPVLAQESAPSAALATDAAKIPVYFGNGCFWGRQKDFVDMEMAMGRIPGQISAVVGYAGGTATGSNGRVCYYTTGGDAVYERLGHAEVVQLELDAGASAEEQMKTFAEVYFRQFQRTKFGMQRLDPQDAGPGYRNVVGIPGGMDSPLYPAFAAQNKNNMQLVRGEGNQFVSGRPSEDDKLNVVYVLDSNKLPFYRAEQYHQYHNGLGKAFPKQYREDMKQQAMQAGRIGPTGCSEFYLF